MPDKDIKQKMRDEFFSQHTICREDSQLRKVSTAPHDLFEWFWEKLSGEKEIREYLLGRIEIVKKVKENELSQINGKNAYSINMRIDRGFYWDGRIGELCSVLAFLEGREK